MRVRRRRTEEDNKVSSDWMTTYGDMVTLLMTFFVMLFAMSNIDAQKFEQITRSFKGSLGISYGGVSIMDDHGISDGMDYLSEAMRETEDMEKIYGRIESYIEESDLIDLVEVLNEEPGLLIRFKENVLFDSGKADLKEDSKEILKYIAQMLSEFNKDIRIEGHTDNVPMNTPTFPSNWELSTQRAVNVLKYFIEENDFDPVRLSAVGYGEYHPIADNDTVEGRRMNRRVDIVILRSHISGESSFEKGDDGANE